LPFSPVIQVKTNIIPKVYFPIIRKRERTKKDKLPQTWHYRSFLKVRKQKILDEFTKFFTKNIKNWQYSAVLEKLATDYNGRRNEGSV